MSCLVSARTLARGTSLAALTALSLACARRGVDVPPPTDSAFAAVQQRGQMAMGVDQSTSTHRFDALPDGGRIELQRNADDRDGVAQIRAHVKLIRHAFEAGDFSTPAFVHMRAMPGTAVMAARRDRITYSYAELPRGAELRIATTDPEALAAIHEFMRAQRGDHRAGGEGDVTHR